MSANKRELIINLRFKTIQLDNNLRKVNPQQKITELFFLFIQMFIGIGTLITFVYLIYSNNHIPDTIIYLSGPILLLLVLWIYNSLLELKAGLIRYKRAKEAFNDGIYALEYATNLLSKLDKDSSNINKYPFLERYKKINKYTYIILTYTALVIITITSLSLLSLPRSQFLSLVLLSLLTSAFFYTWYHKQWFGSF